MVHGVSQKDIRTYKTWEQPPTLDFVLELRVRAPLKTTSP